MKLLKSAFSFATSEKGLGVLLVILAYENLLKNLMSPITTRVKSFFGQA